MSWNPLFSRRRTGCLARRYVPVCESLEDRAVPATVNPSADVTLAILNDRTLQSLVQQGQGFSATAGRISRNDITVENRILSDDATLAGQVNATLVGQIRAARTQLTSTITADNAMIQNFAHNFFSFLAHGNSAAAQFDLAAINAVEQHLAAAAGVYNAQLAAAATVFNADVTYLAQLKVQAMMLLVRDDIIARAVTGTTKGT
jgi:hypothetical protein